MAVIKETSRERQVGELLLLGCDNAEIAARLGIARRTVKAHFNRMFLRYHIEGGVKRVKLAVVLFRQARREEREREEAERSTSRTRNECRFV